jgi:hypothetical protein
MNSFWSKGRNRAVIYGIGALILFGSYVIGAPDSGRTSRKRSPKKAKLEASVSSFNEIQADSPVVNQEPEIPLNEGQITPETVSIGSNKAPTNTNALDPSSSLASNSNIPDTSIYYEPPNLSYPVENMNTSPEVKQKIVERLAEGPKEYPYEIESDLSYDSNKKEAFAWDVAGGRNLNNSKSKLPSTSQEKKFSSSNSNAGRSNSFAPMFYKNQNSLAPKVNGDNSESEDVEDTKSDGEHYDSSIQNPTPIWLADFYRHLHVYSFKKGNGGSLKYPSFNIYNENDYLEVRNVIFTPPDWQLGWETFIKTSLSDAIQTHLLPLGVNGSLVIEIRGAHLFNGPGADFMVVENPFCSLMNNGQTELMKDTVSTLVRNQTAQCFPEPAYIEVSDKPQGPFIRFQPCDGKSEQTSTACAGVVPHIYKPGMDLRNIGGDLYDLSRLNLDKNYQVKFVRITDMSNSTGINGAQGFDLDSFVPFNMKKD